MKIRVMSSCDFFTFHCWPSMDYRICLQVGFFYKIFELEIFKI